ncbi:type I-G CRISPR-associated helicase/endonuclease Cas3g [Actinomadura atramentaria]|uniref:type I-G CRISPR-associated helicase/endonuclease Cas3g n=1 Tax=Actinomadura atramentaria TaxID=1990 RepID=UPI00036675A4|nr:type I-U CRISPR-associated helicase/endonuclease Cas3 [Actinomadura atramentaria]
MTLTADDFTVFYRAVHGHEPLPWQRDLAGRLLAGEDWPAGIDVPTGLGKTSTLDIAVFAAAAKAPAARRRTFFIVDRRLVVDEAYLHARTLAAALDDPKSTPEPAVVARVAAALRPEPGAVPPEVARMRGGATWSWRWVERPDAAAVVVGTVDQIGSRLLMRGYGLGAHLASIDAALVGTDSLLLCDEAHLSQPLLRTLASIEEAVGRDEAPVVVRLSATQPPGDGRVHRVGEADHAHPVAGRRLRAPRRVYLDAPAATKSKADRVVVDRLADWARALADEEPGGGRVVLTVCNTVARARAVFDALTARGVGEDDRVLLIGRSRQIDRDQLIATYYPRIRLGRDYRPERPFHIVATQTVEVGANIDADALVSESAAWGALVQRLGRVGRDPREGRPGVFRAVIVHDPTTADDDPVYGPARNSTWTLLTEHSEPVRTSRNLSVDDLGQGLPASPVALAHLLQWTPPDVRDRLEPPEPVTPLLWPTTLEDWTATSPRPYPDPPVAPYLHGIDARPADVHLVWRADLAADDLPAPGGELDADFLVVPPAAEETLAVSAAAVRRWAAGVADTALSDLEGTAETAADERNAVRELVGLQYTADGPPVAIRLSRVRPGDTVIVPASYGGCDIHGWNPGARRAVQDLADLAHRRDRPIVRLDPRLCDFLDAEHHPLIDELVRAVERDDEFPDEPVDVDTLEALLSTVLLLDDEPATGAITRQDRLLRNLNRLAEAARAGKLRADRRPDGQVVLSCSGAFVTDADAASSSTGDRMIGLDRHQHDVARQAAHFARNLGLPDAEIRAVWLAGRHHDEGKRDIRFQAMLHGVPVHAVHGLPLVAKSDLDPCDRAAFRLARRRSGYPAGMRHETLSTAVTRVLLAEQPPADVDTDLVLHLVAAHHGRARPILPAVPDPDPVTVVVPGTGTTLRTDQLHDHDQPARFHRLQTAYGPWRLAQLEAIVRMADIWCSAGNPVTDAPDPEIPRASSPAHLRTSQDHDVRLPALNGLDALGFLTSLGVLRLLTEEAGLPARLSFDPADGTARLTSPLTDVDAVAARLTDVLDAMGADQILPGVPAGWPPRTNADGGSTDPLRLTRPAYRAHADGLPESARRWLAVIVTDLAADADGRCALTPFMAPAGRQVVATFFQKPLELVRADPAHVHHALTAWRRVPGSTGEYLDHRAIRTAADHPTGTVINASVPGATWLAAHALPLLHLNGDGAGTGTKPRATLWQRINRRNTMRWPLWEHPLDIHATRALLSHPVLTRTQLGADDGTIHYKRRDLAPHGIITVAAAIRRPIPGGQSAGALTPHPVQLT